MITTVQELINELLKYPMNKKVYTNQISENAMGELVLQHEITKEEQRKIDEDIEHRKRMWEEDMERGRDMPTFASRW